MMTLMTSCKVHKKVTNMSTDDNFAERLFPDLKLTTNFQKVNFTINASMDELLEMQNLHISTGSKEVVIQIQPSETIEDLTMEIELLSSNEKFVTDFESSVSTNKENSSFFIKAGQAGLKLSENSKFGGAKVSYCEIKRNNDVIVAVAGLCMQKIVITYPSQLLERNQSFFINGERKFGQNELSLNDLKVLAKDDVNVTKLIKYFAAYLKSDAIEINQFMQIVGLSKFDSDKLNNLKELLRQPKSPKIISAEDFKRVYSIFSFDSDKKSAITLLNSSTQFLNPFTVKDMTLFTQSFSFDSDKKWVIQKFISKLDAVFFSEVLELMKGFSFANDQLNVLNLCNARLDRSNNLSLVDLDRLWALFDFSSDKIKAARLVQDLINKQEDKKEIERLILKHFNFESDQASARKLFN